MKPYGNKANLNCSSSVTIIAGQSKNIGASSSTSGAVLTYKSTTPSICTVDKNGNVTALKTGTGYVTVTASANGYNSVSKDVKIVVSKKSLNNGLLTLSETSYVYDGTYKKPAATVTFGGKVLQEGKDYTISYRNNLNVGVTTVIATGMGDYTGYTSKNFTITKRAMAGGTVSVTSSVSFTGSNITPSVTVKVAGRTLTNGTDYTVSYSNNKNVGTSNVYVYGKGNYSGSLSAKFDIVPAKQQIQKLETKYKGFYIDWAQKGSATGYDVEYSVNANMSGAVSKHLTANKPDTLTVSGLADPLGEDFSIMRTVSLNGMLTSLSTNLAHRNKNVRLYEFVNIYIPNSLPLTELPDERMQMTLGMYGECDFFTLKGVVEDMLDSLGLGGKSEYAPTGEHPFLHPGRAADVTIDGEKIAYIGQIHPEVMDNYNMKGEVYVAVIDMPTLVPKATFDRKYEGVAKFPAMKRDLSMVMKKDIFVGQLEKIFKDKGGKLLESYELFDVYEGDQIEKGYKSVAYSLTFRAKDRTLEDAEVSKIVEKILDELKKLGVELRA